MPIPAAILTWLDRLRRRRTGSAVTGRRGERLAARHLRRSRYRILRRNLANPFGEIDILAEAPDRRTLVVVEVKARQLHNLPGDDLLPELHVNRQKQDKLAAMAAHLARKHDWSDRPIRFDVIGIDLPPKGSSAKPVIRHHEGAFESRL